MSEVSQKTSPLEMQVLLSEQVHPKAARFFNQWISEGFERHDELGGPVVVEQEWGKTYALPVHRERSGDGIDGGIYMAEVSHDSEVVGVGHIINPSGIGMGETGEKPFVGWTETLGEKGRGRGAERLLLMNELAKVYFGSPVESDPDGRTTDEAHRVWRKLEAQGMAEHYQAGEHEIWRFLD